MARHVVKTANANSFSFGELSPFLFPQLLTFRVCVLVQKLQVLLMSHITFNFLGSRQLAQVIRTMDSIKGCGIILVLRILQQILSSEGVA
jgi:hypothetical protein